MATEPGVFVAVRARQGASPAAVEPPPAEWRAGDPERPIASGAAADVTCTHCGLLVPPPLVAADGGPSFCCAGCETVHRIISESGLSDYYVFREATAGQARRPRVTDRTYTEFDDPAFAAANCRDLGDLRATEFVLEGVHCAACVWLVEKGLSGFSGVVRARLNMTSRVLSLVWDPAVARLSSIARGLDDLGYPAHPRRGVSRADIEGREDRALLVRMGVAGAAAGNAMMLAIALYAGAFDGMDAGLRQLFRWGSLCVSLPAILFSGSVFFKGALSALRVRTPHMDLPVSIGILAGTLGGVVGTVRGVGEIYFDSVTALIFLLLVGRFLQRRHQRAAHGAADLVSALAPATARVVTDGVAVDVAAGDVAIGARVEVRGGDRIAVDGEVVEGCSSVDASLLTGESVPVVVSPGDAVFAGTTNVGSRLLIRAERTGEQTRLSELVDKMEEARRARAPAVLLADRIAAVFVVGVLGLAALTFVYWTAAGSPHALDFTIALLVVTCPCALGLATPLTMSSALGQAARAGILVKGGAALEQLAEPGLVVFDKTGTLTAGHFRIEAVRGDRSLVDAVMAAEARSAHPIARALSSGLSTDERQHAPTSAIDDFKEHTPTSANIDDFKETPGGGIEARVDGLGLVVGSLEFVGERIELAPQVSGWVDDLADRALTPVVAASIDGRAVAFGLGDPLRPEAASALDTLRAMGHRLAVLSGDRPEVVDRVVARLGVDLDVVRGRVCPEDKLAFVTEARRRGAVFMVGDGVNDAAALGAATAGIAVHGGAEASLAAADVFSTRGGLSPVVAAFRGARRALSVLRTNLGISLVYNALTASLAVAGLITPLVAAVLMPLSSLTVVTLAYRSRMFLPHRDASVFRSAEVRQGHGLRAHGGES